MTYDWLAAIVFVGSFIAMTKALVWAVFRVPEFEAMRLENREADAGKLTREKYQAARHASMDVGKYINFGFYALVLPFCVSLESRPLWRHVVDVVAILLVFDFMYYWTHRSLFHGKVLRKVHALHHQARKPTWADAQFVHPLETAIGVLLFLVSIPIVAWLGGAPVHALPTAIATLLFTQLNTLNHIYTRLPDRGIFRWVDYVTGVHAAHHVDMNQGNFATLTMFYDKIFGTYEAPVNRATAG